MMASASEMAILGARNTVPGWSALATEMFECKVITGGLTNMLNLVRVKDEAHKDAVAGAAAETAATVETAEQAAAADGEEAASTMALVRIFGEGTDEFIDRAAEQAVCTAVARAGIAPHVFGTFPGGRAEQFLVRAKSLINHDLHNEQILVEVAQLMAKMHTLSLPKEAAHTPLSEPMTPQILRRLYSSAVETRFDVGEEPFKALKLAALRVDTLATEIDRIEDELKSSGMGIVLCHRDLQSGNVMIDRDEAGALKRAYLIDFEYSGKDFCGFDFGNTFNEMSINNFSSRYPGFCLDVDMYPTRDQQHFFFDHYLRHIPDPKTLFAPDCVPTSRDAMIDKLCEFAYLGSLASHMQWTLWGIAQADSSSIDFGHLEYATARFDQYRALRAQHDDSSAP
ncbi:Choline/ethanolamine kinase [Hondaea fermentalgiana]|uniref:ethanolamine kinase n=1 Tax=Hondaea fermentalgiana TaxID=2315210 RepID=A0A2R5GLY5_9STRA|nr:Choline/ethanolamine kinase [Hondaea fermentalgiana]|eukprot:GBG31906.1 Choline/ethanolamine kinase [Hondaea fermentalgiana]